MMKIGFIDYYLDEWHANNYPQMLREASGGEMEVVCAYGMIDHPNGGRTNEQWCADMGIPQAAGVPKSGVPSARQFTRCRRGLRFFASRLPWPPGASMA